MKTAGWFKEFIWKKQIASSSLRTAESGKILSLKQSIRTID